MISLFQTSCSAVQFAGVKGIEAVHVPPGAWPILPADNLIMCSIMMAALGRP